MSEAGQVVLVFVLAFLFAAVEVEIEGPDGWATGLPTWRRTDGAAGRAFGLIMSGRPLTGYHLFMLPLPLAAFHLPFVFGTPWSWRAELIVCAAYLVFAIAWDFLWFVLNPAYGVRRFRPGIWWHPRWAGPAPVDYWIALALSVALAALTAIGASATLLWRHLGLLGGVALLVALTIAVSPRYHAWYVRMRR
jgi:hypothetical protein